MALLSDRFSWRRVSPTVLTGSILVFLLSVYLVLILAFPFCSGDITRPGDEEGLIMDQFKTARILVFLQENSFWQLFRRGELPSARSEKHTVIMSYLFIPFYKFFGPNVWVTRYWHLVFAVPAFFLIYLLTRYVAGRFAGVLALVLLMIHAPFIAGMRVGGTVWSHLHLFSVGALYLFLRWVNGGPRQFLLWGSFLVGLGLATECWFLWFAVALAGAGCLFGRTVLSRLRSESFSGRIQSIFLALLALASGAALTIYREWSTDFGGVQEIFKKTFSPLSEGILIAPLAACSSIFPRFNEMLSSDLLWRHFMRQPADAGNAIVPAILWLAVAIMFAGAFWREFRFRNGKAIFLAVVFFMMFLQTAFTVSANAFEHYFFLYPFPQIIIATVFSAFFRISKLSGKVFLMVAVLFMGVAEIHALGQFFRHLRAFGQMFPSYRPASEAALFIRKNYPGSRGLLVLGSRRGHNNGILDQLCYLLPENRLKLVFLDSAVSSLNELEKELAAAESGMNWCVKFYRNETNHQGAEFFWPPKFRKWFHELRQSRVVKSFASRDKGLKFEVYTLKPIANAGLLDIQGIPTSSDGRALEMRLDKKAPRRTGGVP